MADKTKPFKSEASNLHANHRERMYQRFLSGDSLDGFQQHEILEMLLFPSIPRRNTSETAHRLIDKYGSLIKVMQAPVRELETFKGMTNRAALNLSVIYGAFKILPSTVFGAEVPTLDTTAKALDFIHGRLMYEPYEVLYIICLNAAYKVINVKSKTDYMPQNIALTAETVAKIAFSNHAGSVILAHNHPSGDYNPSAADNAVTREAAQSLANLNILLADHIIIAGQNFFSYSMNTDFIKNSLEGEKWQKLRGRLADYKSRGML